MSAEQDFELWCQRVFFYELVHVVFSGEPSEQLFAVLSSEDCVQTLKSIDESEVPVGALLQFVEKLSEPDFATKASRETASIYRRVILGLGKRVSHPWESTYTSARRLLLQEETLEVREAYRAFGYLPKMYPHVADDHISLECSFLARLAQETIAAMEEEDGERVVALVGGQKAFLENHLLKWMDSYAADLRTDASGSLYELCAAALSAYAKKDAAFLALYLS